MFRSLIRTSTISLVFHDFGFTIKPRPCWAIRSTPRSNIHTSIGKLSPKVDHYKVLGVSRNSSQKEIRKAYIELAKKYHPDTNSGNDDASKLFQQIAIAYTILSSKEQRRTYDASLETEQSQTFESFRRSTSTSSSSSYQSPYETFHSSVNPEELFRKIFGTEFNQSAKYGAESDREWIDYSGTDHGSQTTQTTIVRLTFREAAKGCEKIIQARTLTVCEKCMGVGGEPGKALQLCPFCDGIGYEIVDGLEEKFRVTCRFCKGKGHNVVHKCNHCLGYGRTLVERKIVVPIPAGVTDGETFKINVEPSEGDAARGTIGVQQIFLKFRVEPSDYFSVDGPDLHSSATISIPQAIYGGRIQIDGLWSDETIQIDPGTDSHTVVKLSAKGLKDPNSSGYGDHFVHLKIVIPKKLSSEEDGLLREYSRIENLTVGSINHVQKDSKRDPNSRNGTDPEISEQARAAQRNVHHTVGSVLYEIVRPIDEIIKLSKSFLLNFFTKNKK